MFKMGSLDMSRNQKTCLSPFFKPKLKPKMFLLNHLPDSVIEVRGHQRERSSADQRLRFDSSRMEFSGVFCMSCFHELYTQWKRDRGLLKGNLLSLIVISSA